MAINLAYAIRCFNCAVHRDQCGSSAINTTLKYCPIAYLFATKLHNICWCTKLHELHFFRKLFSSLDIVYNGRAVFERAWSMMLA